MMHKELVFPTPIYVFDYGNSSILQSPLDHVLKCDCMSSETCRTTDDNLNLLPTFSKLVKELKLKGHQINYPVPPIGGGQMILINEERDVLIGASDWRKDGLAIGY